MSLLVVTTNLLVNMVCASLDNYYQGREREAIGNDDQLFSMFLWLSEDTVNE